MVNNTFLRSVIITLSLLIGGSGFLFSSDKSLSTFLFTLKPNIKPLEISKTSEFLLVDNSSIQQFIDTHSIVNVEPWLAGANENDFDGDIYLNRIYRAYIGENRSDIDYLISEMDANIETIYAEPEYLRRPLYVPNDPAFDQQCSMPSVKAIQAWDFWDIPDVMPADEQEILLASVDTGVDYTHPDLVANIWVNQGEIPSFILNDLELFQLIDVNSDGKLSSLELISEAIMSDLNEDGQINLKDIFFEGSPYLDFQDNDGNGYADDLIGWDPAGKYGGDDPDNDPFPKEGTVVTDDGGWAHGSHVAGILAATSDNGVGIASTVFNGKIIPVKTSWDFQNTDQPGISDGYEGILYAAKAGYYAGTFTIINNSWGGGGFSPSEQAVINTAHNTYGAVVVASAGNGSDTGNQELYEQHYPSSYDNVISVCAIGCNGNWGGWASYHPTVDLASPGESIYSTVIGGGYASFNGSSMAGPNAASCIGLLKAFYPNMDNDQLIERILNTADRFIYDRNPEYETCNGNAGVDCLGKGMVDAYKAIGVELSPNIVISSTNLIEDINNSDSDGVANPGEHFSININLENQEGWQEANDIIALLSTNYEGVTINTNSTTHSSLEAGQSFDAEYTFTLSENIALGDIEFNLLTTATGPDNYAFEANLTFDVNVSLHQAGFPVDVTGELISSAALIDFDNDGDIQIISSDKAGFVHRFNIDGFEEIDGWPIETGDQNWGSPAVSQNGENVYFTSKNGMIYNYNSEGLYSWETGGFVTATPALGTLTSSPTNDLVLAQYGGDKLLFAYEDGDNLASLDGFPIELDEKVQRGVALADFNGNGFDDIVFGTDDEFIRLIYDDGTIAWSYETGGDIRVAPSILELNTGEKIILAGSKDDNFYALNSDGSVRFVIETEEDILSEASIIDIEGFGPIIFFSSGNMVYAIDSNGASFLDWPIVANGDVTSSIVFSEVSGQDYVIFGDEAGYIHMYTLTGNSYANFPINYGFPFKGAPTIYDIDSDGDLEIIIGSTQTLVSIDIKESGSADGYWNTHRSNMQRDGHFVSSIDALDISEEIVDYKFSLYQAYPNPFNPTTTIEYELPYSANVVLDVYDVSGKLVKTLVNDIKNTGKHSIIWDGTNQYGNSVANGMYIYKITANQNFSISNKMILLK
tara:strand:+ start:1210 stop:4671 length:3462 start_codon:yes stop_codon:yes gene_type:complete